MKSEAKVGKGGEIMNVKNNGYVCHEPNDEKQERERMKSEKDEVSVPHDPSSYTQQQSRPESTVDSILSVPLVEADARE